MKHLVIRRVSETIIILLASATIFFRLGKNAASFFENGYIRKILEEYIFSLFV